MIFVFGSNEAGRHGAGAAQYAKKYHGAVTGVGFGLQGNSFSIPTKDLQVQTLPLNTIRAYVAMFITFAMMRPGVEFQVTRIGCGLAGYKDSDIAPMFKDAPMNCYFDYAWQKYIGDTRNYWGTL